MGSRSIVRKRKATAVSIPRSMLRFMQPEKKYTSSYKVLQTVGNNSANFSYQFLLGAAQGTGIGSRIADQIRAVEAIIDMRVLLNNTATVVTPLENVSALRLCVFTSSSPTYGNASTPASLEANLWDNGGTSSFVTAFKSPDSEVRLKHDSLIGCNTTGSLGIREFHVKKRVALDQLIKYSPGTTTANFGSAGIYMVTDDATTTLVGWTGNIRIVYVDV